MLVLGLIRGHKMLVPGSIPGSGELLVLGLFGAEGAVRGAGAALTLQAVTTDQRN